MTACAFGSIHQCPAIVERRSGRHLDGHMLAVVHRLEGNGHMRCPVGAHIDQVNVVAFAEGFVAVEGLRRAGKPLGFGKTLF